MKTDFSKIVPLNFQEIGFLNSKLLPESKKQKNKEFIERMASKDGETLFIGGFPPATKQTELRDYFSSYASLVSISIVKNQKEESRGFGYVTFSDPADIKAVIKGVHKIRGKMVSGVPLFGPIFAQTGLEVVYLAF